MARPGDKARQDARAARQSGSLIAEREALGKIPRKARTKREQDRLAYLRRIATTRRQHEKTKAKIENVAEHRARIIAYAQKLKEANGMIANGVPKAGDIFLHMSKERQIEILTTAEEAHAAFEANNGQLLGRAFDPFVMYHTPVQ
jgi:hypothetical protein